MSVNMVAGQQVVRKGGQKVDESEKSNHEAVSCGGGWVSGRLERSLFWEVNTGKVKHSLGRTRHSTNFSGVGEESKGEFNRQRSRETGG